MPKPKLDWNGPRCEYCGEPNIEYSNSLEAEKSLRNKMYTDLMQLGLLAEKVPVEHYAPTHLWQIAVGK